MISDPPRLVSPKHEDREHEGMGRFEHKNRYPIRGLDHDDNDISVEERSVGGSSLE